MGYIWLQQILACLVLLNALLAMDLFEQIAQVVLLPITSAKASALQLALQLFSIACLAWDYLDSSAAINAVIHFS